MPQSLAFRFPTSCFSDVLVFLWFSTNLAKDWLGLLKVVIPKHLDGTRLGMTTNYFPFKVMSSRISISHAQFPKRRNLPALAIQQNFISLSPSPDKIAKKKKLQDSTYWLVSYISLVIKLWFILIVEWKTMLASQKNTMPYFVNHNYWICTCLRAKQLPYGLASHVNPATETCWQHYGSFLR